ncbi:MAG TPA: hypothetical protein VLW85_07535 [Myxococcales bacterium]|nr:hypothetical protein [Myxococcales bacterium]
MVPLNVSATWTRILSVTAGASTAAGAPGPGTRLRGKQAGEQGHGPWLGLIDFAGVKRTEREVLLPWLEKRAEPLLLVRNLLLAKPLEDDVFIELTPRALSAMPEGWRDAPRPILILAPAGRSGAARRRQYLDALSRLRIPLASGGSELWAVREFDLELWVAAAQLSNAEELARFRRALDPSQARLFDLQLPALEAALLDDVVGAREDESAVALDVEALASLYPARHPLAVYSAVERAHNRRRSDEEKTQYSARTLEARLSARGYPEVVGNCTPEFAQKAAAVAPMLDGELQRLFEASELLGQP